MYFRLCGRTVQVCRYLVSYIEHGVERIDRLPTREEADAVALQTGGEVESLDASAYEWMDGIEVPDVPDTYAEAERIAQLGQEGYSRKKVFEVSKSPDQLRADVDYIMLMGGL